MREGEEGDGEMLAIREAGKLIISTGAHTALSLKDAQVVWLSSAHREWPLNATGGHLRHNQPHWHISRPQPALRHRRHPVLLVLDHAHAPSLLEM